MDKRFRTRGLTCAAAVALAGSPAAVAWSQDEGAPRGLRLELDLSTGLRVEDNPDLEDDRPGWTPISETALAFRLASSTKTQTFLLSASSTLSFSTDDTVTPSEYTDPAFALAYTREASRSRLSFNLSQRETDVDSDIPYLVDLDGDDLPDIIGLEADEGTVTYRAASLVLQTGIDRPIGHNLRLNFREKDYSGASDPSLADSRRVSVGSETIFKLSPVLDGTLDASWSRYDVDDDVGTREVTKRVTTGARYQLDDITRIDASIGYSQVDIDEEADSSRRDGVVGSVAVRRDLPRGEVMLTFDADVDEDGGRQTLDLERRLLLPRGSVTASLGATRQDNETNLIGTIDYARDLKDGAISLSFGRGITESSLDEEDELLTRVSAAYRRQITELSSMRLEVLLVQAGSGDDEDTRADFTAGYSRTLTREWDLSLGYRARYKADADDDAVSNSVFATIDRSFVWRP